MEIKGHVLVFKQQQQQIYGKMKLFSKKDQNLKNEEVQKIFSKNNKTKEYKKERKKLTWSCNQRQEFSGEYSCPKLGAFFRFP